MLLKSSDDKSSGSFCFLVYALTDIIKGSERIGDESRAELLQELDIVLALALRWRSCEEAKYSSKQHEWRVETDVVQSA